jgi:hypothetical protein
MMSFFSLTHSSDSPQYLRGQVIRLLILIWSLFALGCGSGSSGEHAIDGVDPETTQRFIGYFSSDGTDSPYTDSLRLTLVNTGAVGVNNEEGRVQIDTAGPVVGEAAIEVVMNSGAAMFYIREIPAGAQIVSYEAEVKNGGQSIEVTSVRFAQYGEASTLLAESWVTPERCLNCHGDFGVPICENRVWEGIHQGIWECSFELPPLPEPEISEGGDPGESSESSDDDDDREPSSKTPKKCLQCHGDRGGPRCGNKKWERLHKWYSCKKKGGKGKGKRSYNNELSELAFSLVHNGGR